MQGALVGVEEKGPHVLPLQSLISSINSHKGFRYKTLCDWQLQKMKF